MSDYDRAEQDFLYPSDRIIHCQMCDVVIDIEEVVDPDSIYCDECYELFKEEQKESEE